MQFLMMIDFSRSPPEISREVHEIIRKTTGVLDPYKKVKEMANAKAKEQLPLLKKLVETAADPLLMAVKMSIIGNVVDFGTMHRYDAEQMIKEIETLSFDETNYPDFKKRLNDSSSVLYLADNTGEIVFDRLLLEQLHNRGKEITVVVKSNPIINDATLEDATWAGIKEFATIMNGDEGCGYSAPGFILEWASPSFLELLDRVDMVISKGQGNYEALNQIDREVFFLLMAKCPLVATNIGCERGTMVLRVNQ
jgi:uncharacterized protein with ATP-grasp and redox domains